MKNRDLPVLTDDERARIASQELLRTTAAAKRLNLSPRVVQEMCQNAILPHLRFRTSPTSTKDVILIPKDELEDFLRQSVVPLRNQVVEGHRRAS